MRKIRGRRGILEVDEVFSQTVVCTVQLGDCTKDIRYSAHIARSRGTDAQSVNTLAGLQTYLAGF